MNNRIVVTKARIEKGPQAYDRWRMIGTLSDGTEESLFSYFSDELQFTPEEVVGKTLDEALEVFTKKDVAYLRS